MVSSKKWQIQKMTNPKSMKQKTGKFKEPKDSKPQRQGAQKTMNPKSGEFKEEPKHSEAQKSRAQKTTNPEDDEPKKW